MVFPAFGQWDTPNESLSIAKFDIDWSEFNIPARDAEIIPFDDIHATTWQVNLQNKILYGHPDAVTVVRLYDANIEDKFIEIGMGAIINNGERIVITNLDVETFAIKSYSVWGLKGSQDPPSTVSGFLNLEVLSGDPKEGPLHMFPFYVVGALGCVVAFLLFTKKRN